LKDPPKFTQIGIFGLKIYHLATLELLQTLLRETGLIKPEAGSEDVYS
jgi:hypothetical protein